MIGKRTRTRPGSPRPATSDVGDVALPSSSLSRVHPLLRGASGALTDLGYLLAAAYPGLRRFWRLWAGAWYRRLARGYARVVDADAAYFDPLKDILPHLPPSAVIVEIGAGTGAATGILRDRFPQASLLAVDLSAEMLALLPQTDARAVVGDAFALPVRDAIADLALVHNAPFAVEELLRVLRPAGLAVVVLSAAGRLPGHIARRLLIGGLSSAVTIAQERRAGAGMAWVLANRDRQLHPVQR